MTTTPWPKTICFFWSRLVARAYTSVNSRGHIKAVDTMNGVLTVESAITWHADCRISHYLASRLWNQPLLDVLGVTLAVRAPLECG